LSNLGYTLAASSATVSGAAGNGAVLLSGYGPWTAVSNAAWLHVAPGSASGGGSALIQFSYDANGGAAAQTGTMTIAGLTFTVTQAGNNYVAAYPVSTLLTPGLNLPRAVAVDAQGNVYIADAANNVVDQWNATTGQMTALSLGVVRAATELWPAFLALRSRSDSLALPFCRPFSTNSGRAPNARVADRKLSAHSTANDMQP
jgi:hypothetical protein